MSTEPTSGVGKSADMTTKGADQLAPPRETREREQVQRRTFYMLCCESCGRYEPPPKPPELSGLVAPSSEPMKCADCGDFLLLVEAFVADETEMWQRSPGSPWLHVAYLDQLPRTDGRQLWMRL